MKTQLRTYSVRLKLLSKKGATYNPGNTVLSVYTKCIRKTLSFKNTNAQAN